MRRRFEALFPASLFSRRPLFFSPQIVKTIEHRMGRYTQVVLDTCAYAGTGNVLKVQEMLHLCAEHLDEKAEHQVCVCVRVHMCFLSWSRQGGG